MSATKKTVTIIASGNSKVVIDGLVTTADIVFEKHDNATVEIKNLDHRKPAN